MVRSPCCENMGLKKGPWTPEEDHILISFIHNYGHENWRALPKQAGLLRCGKSCRLRWTNYLRPDIKRGNFSKEEEETIIKLHQVLGNRWSTIATRLPGRTDNEIKNFWNTHLRKRRINQNVAHPEFIGHSSDETPKWDAMNSRPVNCSSTDHLMRRVYSVPNPPHHNFESSEASMAKPLQQENIMNASSRFPEINGVNEDMKFWYNVFIKAGESQNS